MEKIKCVLHGSMRKHLDLMEYVRDVFEASNIKVIAPDLSGKVVGEKNGYVELSTDKSKEPRIQEMHFLKKVLELGPNDFCYFINPDGILGVSASMEAGFCLPSNKRYIFMEGLKDPPLYVPLNSVWKPEELAKYVDLHGIPPTGFCDPLFYSLIPPVNTVGAMIVDYSKRYSSEREVLLVKTHKWNDRFSIVGGKVGSESMVSKLESEVFNETKLKSKVCETICAFEEISGGYYLLGPKRVFIDFIVKVFDRKVELNHEAEDYIWIPPSKALAELDVEPNARKTLREYVGRGG